MLKITSTTGRRLALWLTVLALAACTSQGTVEPPLADTDTSAGAPVLAPAPEPAPEKSEPPPVYPERPFEPETLYDLLVAELSIRERDYQEAFERYYQQALHTRDPVVAERATQLALHLDRKAEALAAAEIWFEGDPDNLLARQYLANQLMVNGRLQEAIEHMAVIEASGGQGAFARVAQYAARSDVETQRRVIEQLRPLQQRHPDNTQLRFGIALLLARQGGHAAEALALLEPVTNLRVLGVRLKAQLIAEVQDQEAALQFVEGMIQEQPDDLALRRFLAQFLASNDRLKEAAVHFRHIYLVEPRDGEVVYYLALIALEQEDLYDAEFYLKKLVELNFRTDLAHYYLGRLLSETNYERAVGYFELVSPASESFIAAQLEAAQLWARHESVDVARDFLENRRAANPEEDVALTQVLSELLLQHENPQAAFDVLTQGLKRKPDNSTLLYARAMVSERLRNIAQLESDLRRVISLEPEHAEALNALGYTLADQTTRYQEALELIRQALDLKPEEAHIIDSMGWVQYRLNNYEEAVQWLQRALEKSSNHEVAAHLGEVLWVFGRTEEAQQVWAQGLEWNPASEAIMSVMTRLKALVDQ